MDELLNVVSQEATALDLVLHRVTALQLFVSTGRVELVERAAQELVEATAALEAFTATRLQLLAATGHRTLDDLAAAIDPAAAATLKRFTSRLRTNAEVVRATAAGVERSANASARKVEQLLAGDAVDVTWRGYGPRRGPARAGALVRAEV
jgi:hypothetical protein